MTSRIWPAPTDEERAIAAATLDPDTCSDCGMPTQDCECDEDHEEHDFCATCEGCLTCECCECDEVYVHYATKVIVTVDWEGDVVRVVVDSDLADAYDVVHENGTRVPDGPLRDRALNAVREQDWPSWDIG